MKVEEIVNKIYCGDALEILKTFPDNFVHLTVTSPPYNVGMPYKVNDRRNYKEYLDYMKQVFKEVYRITIKGGRLAINLPSSILQSTSSRVAYMCIDYLLFLREIGWLDREIITWIKMPKGEIPGKSTSWGSWCSPSCPYLRDASEVILVMDKESYKRTDKKGKNDITPEEFLKFTSNCWYMSPEVNRKHPAPFPEALPYRLIKLYTWKEDVVLDPFVGSGTTCVVAKKLKRKYIGIDIVPEYVKMSKRRLSQEYLF